MKLTKLSLILKNDRNYLFLNYNKDKIIKNQLILNHN